jgi:hypothetical protein
MPWTRKLHSPIFLHDGRTIATLADARQCMLDLRELHQRNAHWRYAGEMLINASRKQSAVPEAEAQLKVALKAEGLI